jgi:hypothetical protein
MSVGDKCGRSMKLTTYHLVPKSGTRGTSLPHLIRLHGVVLRHKHTFPFTCSAVQENEMKVTLVK